VGIQFSHTYKAVDIWIKTPFSIEYGFVNSTITADFTQASASYDNQIYSAIRSSSLPHGVRYMAAADSGYDDQKPYNLNIDRGFELVCPVSEIYNHTSADRLQFLNFYKIRIRTVNSFLERHICRTINRTHQRCFQNRSLTRKRISESSWYNSYQ
jgi:hypothetical protein